MNRSLISVSNLETEMNRSLIRDGNESVSNFGL